MFSGGMDREAVEPKEGMRRKHLAFDPETMVMFESIAKRDVFRFAPQYYLFACGEEQVSYSTGNGGAFTLLPLIAVRSWDTVPYRRY